MQSQTRYIIKFIRYDNQYHCKSVYEKARESWGPLVQLAKGTIVKNSPQFELLIQVPFYLIVRNIPFGHPTFFFPHTVKEIFQYCCLVWAKGRFLLLSYQDPFSHKREMLGRQVHFQSRLLPEQSSSPD